MRLRDPLHVVVTWDDACDRNVTIHWDGSLDAASKVVDAAPLYIGRQTSGFLVYLNTDILWLAHDYDRDESEIGSMSVIPLGWITKIRTARRVIYKR